ncbi:25786_t:CDS:1, partial [Dentiscutata erythropus]
KVQYNSKTTTRMDKKKTELKSAPPAVKQLNIGGRSKYPLLEDDLKTWVKSLRS